MSKFPAKSIAIDAIVLPRFGAAIGRALLLSLARRSGQVSNWLSVWRAECALRRLDDRMLRDIGLTRAELGSDESRSSWQSPDRSSGLP